MSNITPLPSRQSDDAVDQRVEKTRSLIRTLIDSLPAQEQARIAREISELAGSAPAARAGEVLETVAKILQLKRDWSVAEVKEQVDAHGVPATPKEVYNAIGYLTRKGRVRRIGYGRYVVDGVEIDTSDDFGGETARHEDAYRTDRGTE